MILFRRKHDTGSERLIEEVYRVAARAAEALGLDGAVIEKRKKSVEALGRAPDSLDPSLSVVLLASLVGRHLESTGYKVTRGAEVFRASDIYRQTGSFPVRLAASIITRRFDTAGTTLVVEDASGNRYSVRFTVMRILGRAGFTITVERM